MDKNFWQDIWEQQKIGFHQREINEDLRSFWEILHPVPGENVFVPLCGKSSDMIWLRNRGHPVLGVELSRLAVEGFFEENAIPCTWRSQGQFEIAEGGEIRIFCGDIFDLTTDDIGEARAVYDRAALVALPQAMREKYVCHLLALLQPGARILLVTLEYPESEMDGPPFSVPAAEVERLYGAHCEVRVLSRRSILDEEPRFSERGVTSLHSSAYLITL